MPKYWGKQIFMHGRFPQVGQKQKTEKTIPSPWSINGGFIFHLHIHCIFNPTAIKANPCNIQVVSPTIKTSDTFTKLSNQLSLLSNKLTL